MVVYLVRHGEAVGNTEHRFLGQEDVPLSDTGRHQGERLARRMAGFGLTHVVTSDLRRAADTAAPLLTLTGLSAIADSRWREIANGQWSGLLPGEIADGWPELWARYRGGEDVPRPDGERWADVSERVHQALGELVGEPSTSSVAVFTHGGPVGLVVQQALGLRTGGSVFAGPVAPVANASITTLRSTATGLVLDGYNDVGHLDGPARLAPGHPVAP